MTKKIILLASLLGLLAGCSFNGTDSVPTPLPADYIPTVVALTGQAAYETAQALTPSATATDISTPTQTFTPLPPTATATFTPQPNIPYAQIQFLEPGPMSKVVSPLKLQMSLVAGESGVVQIDLFGEDGRLLGRNIERVTRNTSGVYRSLKIPFEIRAAAEKGLIQVTTKDQYGRIQALNSLRVILLSSGVNEITPPGNLIYERCVLFAPPVKDAAVSGGVVTVEGRMWPFDNSPIFLDLIQSDGKIVGSRIVNMIGSDPQNFSTTIPYKVKDPQPARISVRQMDNALGWPIYIYTQEIMLNP